MAGRLLILLLGVLPKHLMSRAAGWIASRPLPERIRPAVHRGFSRVFGAEPGDAELPLEAYPTVNAFFTRRLRPGLRPVAPDSLVSPVDGAVGASGTVRADVVLQAKGRDYSLASLLGDRELACSMDGGSYLTLYLAPRDYHRVHSPLAGQIVSATYIPGELWPVNVHAVTHVEQLFAVNERIVVTIRRPAGGVMVVVFVGATMVGMTRLAFDDLHTNARRREVQRRTYDPPLPVEAGGPLGHFEFGSTVILLGSPELGTLAELPERQPVRVGQPIGRFAGG